MSEMTVLTGVERNDEDDTGINPKTSPSRVRKNRKSPEVGRANEAENPDCYATAKESENNIRSSIWKTTVHRSVRMEKQYRL